MLTTQVSLLAAKGATANPSRHILDHIGPVANQNLHRNLGANRIDLLVGRHPLPAPPAIIVPNRHRGANPIDLLADRRLLPTPLATTILRNHHPEANPIDLPANRLHLLGHPATILQNHHLVASPTDPPAIPLPLLDPPVGANPIDPPAGPLLLLGHPAVILPNHHPDPTGRVNIDIGIDPILASLHLGRLVAVAAQQARNIPRTRCIVVDAGPIFNLVPFNAVPVSRGQRMEPRLNPQISIILGTLLLKLDLRRP